MSSWPGIFLITVTFRERDGNPVHRSHYNPADKEPILRVKVIGSKGTKSAKFTLIARARHQSLMFVSNDMILYAPSLQDFPLGAPKAPVATSFLLEPLRPSSRYLRLRGYVISTCP